MLIASLTKQGSSNASSARTVCLQFLQVCSRSDPLAMTFFRSSRLYSRCEADCIADGSTLSSHWAEQKHLAPEELSCVCCRCSEGLSSPCLRLEQNCVPWYPLFVPMFLDVSFVRFLLHFVVVLGAWPLLADQYGVVLQGNQNCDDWLPHTYFTASLHMGMQWMAKKEAESSNSEKKQYVAWLRHACLLKVLRTDLSVLETPSHAVPRLLDTIHSLRKNRWKVLWSEVPTGKCLRLFLKWRSLCENVVEFEDESVAEFI